MYKTILISFPLPPLKIIVVFPPQKKWTPLLHALLWPAKAIPERFNGVRFANGKRTPIFARFRYCQIFAVSTGTLKVQ